MPSLHITNTTTSRELKTFLGNVDGGAKLHFNKRTGDLYTSKGRGTGFKEKYQPLTMMMRRLNAKNKINEVVERCMDTTTKKMTEMEQAGAGSADHRQNYNKSRKELGAALDLADWMATSPEPTTASLSRGDRKVEPAKVTFNQTVEERTPIDQATADKLNLIASKRKAAAPNMKAAPPNIKLYDRSGLVRISDRPLNDSSVVGKKYSPNKSSDTKGAVTVATPDPKGKEHVDDFPEEKTSANNENLTPIRKPAKHGAIDATMLKKRIDMLPSMPDGVKVDQYGKFSGGHFVGRVLKFVPRETQEQHSGHEPSNDILRFFRPGAHFEDCLQDAFQHNASNSSIAANKLNSLKIEIGDGIAGSTNSDAILDFADADVKTATVLSNIFDNRVLEPISRSLSDRAGKALDLYDVADGINNAKWKLLRTDEGIKVIASWGVRAKKEGIDINVGLTATFLVDEESATQGIVKLSPLIEAQFSG